MEVKKINDTALAGKKVLLRVDFNVAIEDGHIQEEFKIKAPVESVKYILNKKAKLALITHLGRPEGERDEKYSLRQIVGDAERVLGVKIKFVPDCIGAEVRTALEELPEGEVLLLDNVRFHKEEEENDPEFAQKLAENFEVFVNDAFSVCHRDQASVTGVTKFLESYAGFRLQKEIEEMDKIKNNEAHPAVAIIGGSKIETKLPLIAVLEKNYDQILVGSKVAIEAAEKNISFSNKVVLPTDYAGDGLDIGEETIAKFREIILGAKAIVWNGPLGKFEEKPYDRGTVEILRAIVESGAFSAVGGGESVEALEKNGLLEKISFVSTGGGAMLEYLSGNQMPGIEAVRVV